MSRTILAAAVLIGLVACGGGTKQPSKRAAASASRPAGTAGTATQPAQQGKKKGTARPDTAAAKNPLTN